MRRKLTTLRAKQGHSQNGAPRSLIDDALYREHHAAIDWNAGVTDRIRYDSAYSGWSNFARPRDQAVSLISFNRNVG